MLYRGDEMLNYYCFNGCIR